MSSITIVTAAISYVVSALRRGGSRILSFTMRFRGRVREQSPAKTGHAHYQPCGKFRSRGKAVSTQPPGRDAAPCELPVCDEFQVPTCIRCPRITTYLPGRNEKPLISTTMISHVCVSKTAYVIKRPKSCTFLSENADAPFPPGCLPLVTKLLGELPVPKRIHGSFKRVVDMDYQIRGQCSLPVRRAAHCAGTGTRKIDGGAAIMLDSNWIGASSYNAVYLVHRIEALV